MTAFQRLGLYTASAAVVGAIAWVTENIGLWIGVSALVGGAILAAFATFELRQELPPEPELEEGPTEEQRREVLRARDRAAIVKDAVAAREEARGE